MPAAPPVSISWSSPDLTAVRLAANRLGVTLSAFVREAAWQEVLRVAGEIEDPELIQLAKELKVVRRYRR